MNELNNLVNEEIEIEEIYTDEYNEFLKAVKAMG